MLLIFDEAQNLNRSALEELRMFTNINSNKDELLQLLLVGQPELRDIVMRPDMTPVRAAGFGALPSQGDGRGDRAPLHRASPEGRRQPDGAVQHGGERADLSRRRAAFRVL